MNNSVFDVLKILNKHGFEAYLVGGYPRDMLLNIKSDDYDICTNAKPEELLKIFKQNVLANNYGSLKINYNNKIYEITTFRHDLKYINNRKPILIEYVDDLIVDLQRRDFTINTICIDQNGKIIDLLNGREDIKNKIIRVVGNSDHKISQDSLRILRAIRFATILNFNLSDDLYNSIKKYGYLVKELSYDRKKAELDKIFSSSNLFYGLKLLKELNLDLYLDININNLKKTSLLGIWAQVDSINYKFNRKDQDTIHKIKELTKLDILDNYNLYKYGLSISIIAGEINDINRSLIISKYNELPIKCKKDINIDMSKILNILDKSIINKVIKDIEIKIVNKMLINVEEKILKYIKETYL